MAGRNRPSDRPGRARSYEPPEENTVMTKKEAIEILRHDMHIMTRAELLASIVQGHGKPNQYSKKKAKK